MSGSLENQRGRNRPKLADPETMLQAAESAPALFDFGRYYPALQVMREKGYSWRQLGEWVRGFNVEISHVHLRRLFVRVSERVGRNKSVRVAASGRKRPAAPRPAAGPVKAMPPAAPARVAVDQQQDDLLRYEGIS